MRELPLKALAACVVASAAVASASQKLELAQRGSFTTTLAIAAERFAELDATKGEELLAISELGEVRSWTRAADGKGFDARARGDLVLADPKHSVVQLASVLDGETTPQLVVADARGVHAFRSKDAGFGGEPVELVPSYKQRLRVGAPVLAPIVQDVNADGRDDLVLPSGDELEVWVRRAPATKGTATKENEPALFARVAKVHVEVARARESSADALSDVLSARLTIPDLALADVNGDGRADLAVIDGEKRAYHLVRADGSIPETPDVVLDLSIFKDTTPQASLVPGRTLAGGDETRHETRDLDGDGIPDHVIAHRRKVWVFPGTKNGPQFTEPSTILKAADDITAFGLVRLDADERADLLLFKLQVPSIGEILRGLLREWSVAVECAGYANKDGRSFETSPRWRSTVEVRLPAILDVVKNPEAIVKRFEEVGRKFRSPSTADLDGDGKSDVAIVGDDKTKVDVWRGDRAAPPERTGTALASSGGLEREDEALLEKILFEEPNKTWDLDRMLAWMGGYAEQRVARVTGGRAADAVLPLRDPAKFTLLAMKTCDVDGDGRAELVAEYSDLETPQRVFDVFGAR